MITADISSITISNDSTCGLLPIIWDAQQIYSVLPLLEERTYTSGCFLICTEAELNFDLFFFFVLLFQLSRFAVILVIFKFNPERSDA